MNFSFTHPEFALIFLSSSFIYFLTFWEVQACIFLFLTCGQTGGGARQLNSEGCGKCHHLYTQDFITASHKIVTLSKCIMHVFSMLVLKFNIFA